MMRIESKNVRNLITLVHPATSRPVAIPPATDAAPRIVKLTQTKAKTLTPDFEPSWIRGAVGSGRAVDFGELDQTNQLLGRGLITRWFAAGPVPADNSLGTWGPLAALAWIACRDLGLAQRAAYFDHHAFRPGLPPSDPPEATGRPSRLDARTPGRRNDPLRRHELAVLQYQVSIRCSCRPHAADWISCRCLDRALEQVKRRIEAGELSAWAVLANGRRKIEPWDIVELRRPERGLAWLQLAEGVRQLEFDARELVQLFNVASPVAPPGRPEADDAADLGKMKEIIGGCEAVTIGKAALSVLRAPGRHRENALEDSIKRRLVRKYRELVAIGDAPCPVAQVEK